MFCEKPRSADLERAPELEADEAMTWTLVFLAKDGSLARGHAGCRLLALIMQP